MAIKITISKQGYEADTESDVNNYIFHSDYNTFKIIGEGILSSQSVTANPSTFSVAHGVGVVPAVMAFIEYPDGYVTVPRGMSHDTTSAFLDVVNSRYWVVEVDDTYIYFVCYKGTTANYSVNIRYYIFEAPGD